MTIDNAIYSRDDYQWWGEDRNSTNVLLRYFINPIRFSYFIEQMNRLFNNNIVNIKLLDVGCGGGYLCEEFAKIKMDVAGIDVSKNSLMAARKHAEQGGLHIEYEEGKAEELPFDNSSFDYVSCCDVLEHVDCIEKTIAEISGVLRPGGLFLYDTINRTFISWLMMIKIAQEWKSTAWEAPNTHEWRRFVRISELGSLLEDNGLIMKENKGIVPSARMSVVMNAIRERAKGKINRFEMASQFKFEISDKVDSSYLGYAIKKPNNNSK